MVHQGALLSPVNWSWYGLHMQSRKTSTTCLYQVCYAYGEITRLHVRLKANFINSANST